MKYKGIVTSTSDPENIGRIKVKVLNFQHPTNVTPWCFPCAPFGGNGFGIFFVPSIGDEVFVEMDADGDWLYVGALWSSRNPKPSEGSTTSRVIKTPAGHTITLNDNGSLKITGRNGGGYVEIVGDEVLLNGSGGDGVVTKECICAFTGDRHPQASRNVKAKGPI